MSNDTPRLSYTTAKHLLACPAKAYLHHRLLGGVPTETTDAMENGNLFERLITGHDAERIVTIDAPDWRTKAAREARDEAQEAGKIPVLECKFAPLRATAELIREKITSRIEHWADAMQQVRMEWESDGVQCSGVIDQLHIGKGVFRSFDLKSTKSADPDYIDRVWTRLGYDIQEAAYIEAVESNEPELMGRGWMTFIFYETSPPYCVTPVRTGGAMRELGRRKWSRAKEVWAQCLRSDSWPEYVSRDSFHMVSARPWELGEYDIEPEEITSEPTLEEVGL